MNKYQKIKEEKFIEACIIGNWEEVKFWIANGVDIHINNDQGFRWACLNGHYKIVKFLVEKSVDVHAYNDLKLR